MVRVSYAGFWLGVLSCTFPELIYVDLINTKFMAAD